MITIAITIACLVASWVLMTLLWRAFFSLFKRGVMQEKCVFNSSLPCMCGDCTNYNVKDGERRRTITTEEYNESHGDDII